MLIEFLVVDTHSAYHGVLGRSTLKDLRVVTSIHHLAMKLSTFGGVAKIRDKAMDVDPEKVEEEMILDENLDPQIIGLDSSASLTEELETFSVNPFDPTQMVQV
ncbi:Uncharacterized protein Adt_27734 [Abeliophyllum distichum]|uniref:Uncharacterized protein n=1 Tax=Abeliophyllum distichum TaxID=126358 RepID=A0ABD1RVA3_9LAMI